PRACTNEVGARSRGDRTASGSAPWRAGPCHRADLRARRSDRCGRAPPTPRDDRLGSLAPSARRQHTSCTAGLFRYPRAGMLSSRRLIRALARAPALPVPLPPRMVDALLAARRRAAGLRRATIEIDGFV